MLTVREKEQIREAALKTMRKRLQDRKPDPVAYEESESKATRIIAATLVWSRAAVPGIAILAALASSVRTVQVVSSIYSQAGSHAIGVTLAALAFTLAAEGALFVLALAAAGEDMRRRAEGQQRHVFSLAGVWRAILVRIGLVSPLRHDELPEQSGGLGLVIGLALMFTLSTNLYMGMRPLIDEIGASSLQSFIGSLWSAPARLQMVFIVDLSAALFAPLVAFSAGHLTARFAAEVATAAAAGRAAYADDLARWRAAMADPLQTAEGQELIREHEALKLQAKAARKMPVNPTSPLIPEAVPGEEDTQEALAS